MTVRDPMHENIFRSQHILPEIETTAQFAVHFLQTVIHKEPISMSSCVDIVVRRTNLHEPTSTIIHNHGLDASIMPLFNPILLDDIDNALFKVIVHFLNFSFIWSSYALVLKRDNPKSFSLLFKLFCNASVNPEVLVSVTSVAFVQLSKSEYPYFDFWYDYEKWKCLAESLIFDIATEPAIHFFELWVSSLPKCLIEYIPHIAQLSDIEEFLVSKKSYFFRQCRLAVELQTVFLGQFVDGMTVQSGTVFYFDATKNDITLQIYPNFLVFKDSLQDSIDIPLFVSCIRESLNDCVSDTVDPDPQARPEIRENSQDSHSVSETQNSSSLIVIPDSTPLLETLDSLSET